MIWILVSGSAARIPQNGVFRLLLTMTEYATGNFADFIIEWRKKLFRKDEQIYLDWKAS